MISRILTSALEKKLGSKKAIIIMGPRQVGKTSLIETILSRKENVLYLNGDDPLEQRTLTNPNTEELLSILKGYDYVFIDEAQRIENIGITLKLIIDRIKSVQLLVSGSSSFELANKINEPLTGRKWEYQLFPISWQEFENDAGVLKAKQQLAVRLVYGMYPEVVTDIGNESEILTQLGESYLFKDILAFGGIRKPEVLKKILQALAYQVGSEVNYAELSRTIGVDAKTINSYIEILEQGFVVFLLSPYSRNLRNEIKSNQKVYFYDNGIRNMIIGNLDPISIRTDVGALWENFLVSERMKKNAYDQRLVKAYFWRTTQQQEIDYVEEEKGKISGWEFKWSPKSKVKISKTFTENYQADVQFIHQDNFREFLIG